MWTSLGRLRALPDDMRVYCAHEYTQSNARFAVTIEADNKKLLDRSAAIDATRARGEATVPSLLGEEKATNPFLRADVAAVQRAVDRRRPGGGVRRGASPQGRVPVGADSRLADRLRHSTTAGPGRNRR